MYVGEIVSHLPCVWYTVAYVFSLLRIASSNNLNKSESDQEDNDDINDNDWSYGSEKKGIRLALFHPHFFSSTWLIMLILIISIVCPLTAKKRRAEKVFFSCSFLI